MPLLRAAEPADALAVADVHVRSWQAGYRGLLPDAYLASLRPEDRARRYGFGATDPRLPATIVALEDGAIRGFATTSPARDPDRAGQGELCALYVDPAWWGRKIGLALIAAARDQLVRQGFTEAVLWLLVGNVRGGRFYGTDGWAPDGARRAEEMWGVTVDEVRYGRRLP